MATSDEQVCLPWRWFDVVSPEALASEHILAMPSLIGSEQHASLDFGEQLPDHAEIYSNKL